MPARSANMMRFPERRFTVLVLCNRKGVNPIEVSYKVADVYLEQELDPAGSASADLRGDPLERTAPPPLSALPVSEADAYVGTYYQVYGGDSIAVGTDNGRLSAIMYTTPVAVPLALSPVADGVSFAVSGVTGIQSLVFHAETPSMAASIELRSAEEDLKDPFVRIPPLSDAEAAMIAGRYYGAEIQTTYVVTANGRFLSIRQGERPGRVIFARLVRIAPDRFLRGGETGVEIRRDERGEVIGLTVFSERDIRLDFQKLARR